MGRGSLWSTPRDPVGMEVMVVVAAAKEAAAGIEAVIEAAAAIEAAATEVEAIEEAAIEEVVAAAAEEVSVQRRIVFRSLLFCRLMRGFIHCREPLIQISKGQTFKSLVADVHSISVLVFSI